jgi:hypothetical protein
MNQEKIDKEQTNPPNFESFRSTNKAGIRCQGDAHSDVVSSVYEYTEGSRNNAYIVTSHCADESSLT